MFLQKLKFVAYHILDLGLILVSLLTIVGLMEASFNVIEFSNQGLRVFATIAIVAGTLTGSFYLMFELQKLFGYKNFPVDFKDTLTTS